MSSRIAVPPDLHPLDCPQPSDVAVRISPSVGVRPDDVDIKPVDQFSPSNVPLELNRAVDAGEIIFHLDIFIMDDSG